MKHKLSLLKNPLLGIAVEVVYSLCIMLMAYCICFAVLVKKWF